MSDETFEASRRALMGGGAAGLAMLGLFATEAQAQTMTPAEAANVKVVNDFLKAGEKPKDAAAGMPFFAPDAAYRMTETMPWDKGHEAIVARLKPFVDNADKIEFKVLRTAVMGPIVINHRIDTFTSKVRPLLFEGVGVFFLKNGKIQEWTDYTIRAALSNEWPKS